MNDEIETRLRANLDMRTNILAGLSLDGTRHVEYSEARAEELLDKLDESNARLLALRAASA